jgi:hypothetical protein
MSTKHNKDGERLSRRDRRKKIRRSFVYQVRRWLRRGVAVQRTKTVLGWLASMVLLVCGGLLMLVYLAGADAGLLPTPWPRVVAVVGGITVGGLSLWLAVSGSLKRANRR